VGEQRTAGEVLLGRLTEQVAELHRRDAEVRDGVADGVHQFRVTCRRLRGALATFRPLVDREVTDPVRDELRWLARTLSGGRDAEVVHARLRALVDDLPPSDVVGPVRRRLERTYAARRRVAAEHAAQVLDSPRYARLRNRLDDLVAQPPFTERAGEPAAEVLRRRVRHDLRRLRKRVEAVADAAPRERDHAWHQARKAAKRLRYAAEALEPDFGKDAAALVADAKDVTKHLGERQDTVVARADLRAIARDATSVGESAFTYGVLHEVERSTAAGLDGEFDEIWRRVRKRKRRAWLSSP
jgi:CHAD domain-containing protein